MRWKENKSSLILAPMGGQDKKNKMDIDYKNKFHADQTSTIFFSFFKRQIMFLSLPKQSRYVMFFS